MIGWVKVKGKVKVELEVFGGFWDVFIIARVFLYLSREWAECAGVGR